MDVAKELENAISAGMREAVKNKLSSYNSPLNILVKDVVEKYRVELEGLLDLAISTCISNEGFKQGIAEAVNRNLAKILIQRFGGEVEKQVNALKSDPITRARITLAIEQIVKDANK